METLALVVTIFVCLFVAFTVVGLLLTRLDTLKNLTPAYKLRVTSNKRLSLLRVYIKNSGLKRNAEKYLEYDEHGPVFNLEKDDFVRKLTLSRAIKFQLNCLLVCLAALWLTHSAVLTGALFFFYFACALNEPLYVKIIAENPGVLVD